MCFSGSDGPILALSLLVMSRAPDGWQCFPHIASGLSMLYLVQSAYLSWRRFHGTQPPSAPPFSNSVVKASMMNAFSPSSYLFWSLVTGPILLEGWRRAPVIGLGFLLAFCPTMVISLAATILVFGMTRKLGRRINRARVGISAIAL